MKKYGDAVIFVDNAVQYNALVAQSQMVEGEESLTIIYLKSSEKTLFQVPDILPMNGKRERGWSSEPLVLFRGEAAHSGVCCRG